MYILPVGIRTVRVEDRKFLINNVPFYFKGFGKIQDGDVSGFVRNVFSFQSQLRGVLRNNMAGAKSKNKRKQGIR